MTRAVEKRWSGDYFSSTASSSARSRHQSDANPAAAIAPTEKRFPKDFVWGCATSAYQIEGAANVDGRGTTNWDVFAHADGRVKGGDTGDEACDSYCRFTEDSALLKALGVRGYRMSVSWARIFPNGRGQPNMKGVDHYKRVFDDLLEHDIKPYLTLFHWELPAVLPGGWQSRDTAYAVADYASYMASQVQDRVKHLMTVNEIVCYTDLSYKIGQFAPGLMLPGKQVNQIRHHGVLAQGLEVQAIRANVGSDVRIGIAENPNISMPAIETAEHVAAAQRATRETIAPFLTAIMEGKYFDSYLIAAGADAPLVRDGDMKAIGSPLDFVGLNIYTGRYVSANNSAQGYVVLERSKSSPYMTLPWLLVEPESVYWTVRQASELWRPETLYITENGCSADDKLTHDRVDDADRIMYLCNCIGQMHRAVAESYPLRGYFLWSLLDAFEWAERYSARFGLHYFDNATQRRIPKSSPAWYRSLIAQGALV